MIWPPILPQKAWPDTVGKAAAKRIRTAVAVGRMPPKGYIRVQPVAQVVAAARRYA
ncbi:hypothetical protein [uncultured Megasphaera sp.]|uniref:hypothetical protein n=1 Tax=uncultured Megasphaera sp. TaxID=165188 RepID=UPI0025983C0C|nr:hypothetical protein [uncultured Megasphaera sp.]